MDTPISGTAQSKDFIMQKLPVQHRIVAVAKENSTPTHDCSLLVNEIDTSSSISISKSWKLGRSAMKISTWVACPRL